MQQTDENELKTSCREVEIVEDIEIKQKQTKVIRANHRCRERI
jgi:hypothetical protein